MVNCNICMTFAIEQCIFFGYHKYMQYKKWVFLHEIPTLLLNKKSCRMRPICMD